MAGNKGSFAERPPAERAELGRRGGIASGAARRQRRQRELFSQLLCAPCPDGDTEEELRTLGLEPTLAAAAAWAVVKKALAGSLDAMKYIRDTLGEKAEPVSAPLRTLNLTELTDEQLLVLAGREDTQPAEPSRGDTPPAETGKAGLRAPGAAEQAGNGGR